MKVLVAKAGVRRYFVWAGLLAIVAISYNGFFSDTALAANCTPNRSSCNNSESFARSNCIGSDVGAIWFNNGSTAGNNTGGYYTDDVAISGNATSVTVYIRGSACDTGRPSGYGVYAVDIRPAGDATSQRLRLGGTKYLFRGNFNGHTWTTQGSSLAATLNVSGLATNNRGHTDTASITISLGRCYSGSSASIGWNGVPDGRCYYDPVKVNITRAANPLEWTVTPSASISSAASVNKPGQTLTWSHTVRNNGPDATTKTLTYKAQNQGALGSGVTNTWTRGSGLGSGSSVSQNSTHKITQSDVGKNLCRRTTVAPRSSTSSSTLASGNACRLIPYNYTLSPQISITPTLLRQDQNSIQVAAAVNNTGVTITDSVHWYVTRFIVAPGDNYSKAAAAAAACTQFSGYQSGTCKTLKDGTKSFALGSNSVANFTDNFPGNPPPGSEICYLTSVNKGSSSSPTWKHSSVACATIEQIASAQVLGNDLRVGSSFSGTNVQSDISGYVFDNAASWGEYGILAPGTIGGFASQSGANGGSSAGQSSWSKLTFANTGAPTGCTTGYGCFTAASNLGTIPDVKTFTTTATYNGSALNYNKGSASFSASDIPGIIAGANLSQFTQSASITTTGTITIDKDITYKNGTLNDIGNLPQLILIAKNINITGNVKHIDAWLVATGTINTCSDVAQSALRTGNCSNQLQVNGAIMANQLEMSRTYYDSAKPNQAAETFNLRGDSYAWASNIAHQNGQWQTVYSTDLPPRY